MAGYDDDLEQVPWWDAKALRMADAFEGAIVRLNLDSQGEFVAIMNAIVMQLESKQTVPEVVRILVESLRALAPRPRHRGATSPSPRSAARRTTRTCQDEPLRGTLNKYDLR